MSVFKRPGSKYYSYEFVFKGDRKQGSTGMKTKKLAEAVEEKIKTDLRLGLVGMAPKPPAPPFKTFLEGRFLAHKRRLAKKAKTVKYHEDKVARLLDFRPWADLRLDEINEDLIGQFIDRRRTKVGIGTTNGDLRTLRHALRLAYEWQLIIRRPAVHLLPGERRRKFVVSAELERAYLATAPYPLREAAILIFDLGLRPEECVRLRKGDIVNGCVVVPDGKTENAARTLPLTERAAAVIRLLSDLWPDSDWLFPGKKGTHYHSKSLSNIHTKLRDRMGWPEAFVLYGCRHTFATGLGASGADLKVIAALMGHADIRMASQYVHPQTDTLSRAMKHKELMDKITRGEVVPTEFTTDVRK